MLIFPQQGAILQKSTSGLIIGIFRPDKVSQFMIHVGPRVYPMGSMVIALVRPLVR